MSILMRKYIFTITLSLISTCLFAVDVESGRLKSESCAACHGPEGNSFNSVWPNLAGQKAAYIISQLKDYRAGHRCDPWMSPMAKPLTDKEIEDLAAFYSNLQQ
jgi:cytochrome c553